MLQFFGILTALDCTNDLLLVGVIGLLVGVMIGAVSWHFLASKIN